MRQTYQYIIANSILGIRPDEYAFNEREYYKLYSFYVTYSMCGTQSARKRTFVDYGWPNEYVKNTNLGTALSTVLNLNRNNDFVFTEENDLALQFSKRDLQDGELLNVDTERAVVAKTTGLNNHIKLFYRIRDGLAHGKFKLRLSSKNEKMIVIQDDDSHNITARIVIKLNTILSFIDAIDIRHLI